MKIKFPYFKSNGEAGEAVVIDIDEKIYKANDVLVSQALHVEQNRTSVKPGLTKTKAEVSGGGRKPWKQKGTGRARAGSNRSPLWRGGGITFGPTADSKTLSIPKKMKDKAFELLLIEKTKDNNVIILESIKLDEPKTKFAAKVVEKIAPAKRAIIALDEADMQDGVLAWRNLAQADIKNRSDVRLSDLSSGKMLVYSAKAFETIKTRLSK